MPGQLLSLSTKYYAPAHISIDWMHKMHMQDVTIFTNLCCFQFCDFRLQKHHCCVNQWRFGSWNLQKAKKCPIIAKFLPYVLQCISTFITTSATYWSIRNCIYLFIYFCSFFLSFNLISTHHTKYIIKNTCLKIHNLNVQTKTQKQKQKCWRIF